MHLSTDFFAMLLSQVIRNPAWGPPGCALIIEELKYITRIRRRR